MYSGQDFPTVSPDETTAFLFDFVKHHEFTQNEFLVSATWTIEVAADSRHTDADPNSHLLDAATIRKSVVTNLPTVTAQHVTGLLHGVRYVLIAEVTTNFSQLLELFSYVQCRALT